MRVVLGWIMFLLGIVSGILLHCWTVYWIYSIHGMFWAFVGFATPPFSELLMAGASISAYGWTNQYLILWVATLVSYKIGEILLAHEPKVLEENNVN